MQLFHSIYCAYNKHFIFSDLMRIIGIVDTVGLKLVVQGQSQSILSPSLALAVKLVDGALFSETTFTITNPSNIQVNTLHLISTHIV